eukprot:CAMPEP_0170652558 /NCGR_PEP_ID=MMETSP0224-20130122/46963_1 /TAXON_ID=285029 /ORGANISM="Togula jolla, Strain CCCM 725" /LENGTH=76 /DNA_ID=CAMNT_0010984421 /DNA_START=160 /DNA_END=390 /DNA_ORIENTATION=-
MALFGVHMETTATERNELSLVDLPVLCQVQLLREPLKGLRILKHLAENPGLLWLTNAQFLELCLLVDQGALRILRI